MTEYIFKTDIAGSNNGYDVTFYKKGQKVVSEELCDYLTKVWKNAGVIVEAVVGNAGGVSSNENDDLGTNIPNGDKSCLTDTSDIAELTDETVGELIFSAREILEKEELTEADIDNLKKIGIELKIEGMHFSKKPQTIVDKINAYIDQYENIGEEDIPLE